jgi:hypothetical protein
LAADSGDSESTEAYCTNEVGVDVGWEEGTIEGCDDGCSEGRADGCIDGWTAGWLLGCMDGWLLGTPLGWPVPSRLNIAGMGIKLD